MKRATFITLLLGITLLQGCGVLFESPEDKAARQQREFQTIRAKVPLAEMNKYSTTLSSISSGRASYEMHFAEYQAVPADVQAAVIKKYEEENKEEE